MPVLDLEVVSSVTPGYYAVVWPATGRLGECCTMPLLLACYASTPNLRVHLWSREPAIRALLAATPRLYVLNPPLALASHYVRNSLIYARSNDLP